MFFSDMLVVILRMRDRRELTKKMNRPFQKKGSQTVENNKNTFET